MLYLYKIFFVCKSQKNDNLLRERCVNLRYNGTVEETVAFLNELIEWRRETRDVYDGFARSRYNQLDESSFAWKARKTDAETTNISLERRNTATPDI